MEKMRHENHEMVYEKKKIANVFIRFHFFSFFRPNNEKLGYDVKID